jgi:hypothetical protein
MKDVTFFKDDGVEHGDSIKLLKTYDSFTNSLGALQSYANSALSAQATDSLLYMSRVEDTDYTISNGVMIEKVPNQKEVSSGTFSGNAWTSSTTMFWNSQWIEYRYINPITVFKVSLLTDGSGAANEVTGFRMDYKVGSELDFRQGPSVLSTAVYTVGSKQIDLYLEYGIRLSTLRIVFLKKHSYVGIEGSFQIKLANVAVYGFSHNEVVRIIPNIPEFPTSNGIVVPLYIYPDVWGGFPTTWGWSEPVRLATNYPHKTQIYIINPPNAPGVGPEFYPNGQIVTNDHYNYTTGLNEFPSKETRGRVKIIGYINILLGTKDVSGIQIDIDRWYSLYGTHIDGIFLDDSNDRPVEVLTALCAYIRGKDPNAYIMLNDGVDSVITDLRWSVVSNVARITYENTYSNFSTTNPLPTSEHASMIDSSRRGLIIHSASGLNNSMIDSILVKAKAKNYGLFYVTANAYATFSPNTEYLLQQA